MKLEEVGSLMWERSGKMDEVFGMAWTWMDEG
jgi:hypothetical protein